MGDQEACEKSDQVEPQSSLQPIQRQENLERSASGTSQQNGTRDFHIVTWDGPDDLANPKNWSFRRRWAATALVSLITFMTPIASSMIAPAEEQMDRDLGVRSTVEFQLIFSIFLLAFAIGPLLLAPMSELYGRVVILQLANVWFLIFNLVCGFVRNAGEMLAFRFLAGLGACSPQTIGGGVLSDIWTSEERGMAVAVYTLAPILGPALGPLIGAWVTEKTTWRWSFWAVTIFGVCVQMLFYLTASETYAPRILQLKAQRLRKETGNELYHTEYELTDRRLKVVLRKALVRVFVMLGTQPIVQFLALYMALAYGIIYLLLSVFPLIWTGIYRESVGIGGLNYISLIIGLTFGAQLAGRLVDGCYKKLKRESSDGEGHPEFRAPPLFLSTAFMAGGLLVFGWSAQERTHWIVPNIGAAIFGAGASMTMAVLQTYTIDSYPLYAASAVGATAVARSMTGFAFPLFANRMYDALGQGWGNSILGFAIVVIGYTGSLILWFFGKRLRQLSQYAADK